MHRYVYSMSTVSTDFAMPIPKRAMRAYKEGDSYTVRQWGTTRLGDIVHPLYHVVSESMSQYMVAPTMGSCTCPDHRYRGTFCKHQIVVALREDLDVSDALDRRRAHFDKVRARNVSNESERLQKHAKAAREEDALTPGVVDALRDQLDDLQDTDEWVADRKAELDGIEALLERERDSA